VILSVPFLTRLPAEPPEHRTDLIVYTSVVVLSGLLAARCLLVGSSNRLGSRVHQAHVLGRGMRPWRSPNDLSPNTYDRLLLLDVRPRSCGAFPVVKQNPRRGRSRDGSSSAAPASRV
jgi:hypothetical protein